MKPGRSPLRSQPAPAQIYICAVGVVGFAILAARFALLPVPISTEQLVLIGFAILLGSQTVHLGMRLEMSGALPFIFTALLMPNIGYGGALDVALAGMLSSCLLRRKPFEPHRTVFNVGSILITVGVAGGAYSLFAVPGTTFDLPGVVVPLTIAILLYYLVNTAMVAVAIGLTRRVPIIGLWRESFLWTVVSYFAGGSIAVGMVCLIVGLHVTALVIGIPPVILIQRSWRLYHERSEERKKRIAEIEKLNAELEERVAQRTQELRETNQKLQESNEQLQQANRLKSEFLANMSHELRTPLNAILGFSELLKEEDYGPLGGEQREFVRDIHESGRHLLSLINDILDLSKIEAGRMNLSREEFSVVSVARECLLVIRPLGMKKNLTVESDLVAAPSLGWADAGMIKQILYNLLSNAVKFTPEGGAITLRCHAEGRELVFAVEDTGIGIATEDQSRIFSEFYQVDGSYARRYQGTGLGLALVKRFIEMHGGTIGVKSEPGKGSVFLFRIPDGARTGDIDVLDGSPQAGLIPEDPGFRLAPVHEASGDRGVILVVEDNPMNLKLVRSILTPHGYEVIEAMNSEEALTRLAERIPDLILMDVQIPGKDGLELTRQIKRDPRTASIPTVALTAHVMKGDEERALEAGCSGYIPKPIDPSRFCEQIEGFLREKCV